MDLVPTPSRLRPRAGRTRAIARTRQSERVRAAVDRNRMSTAQNIQVGSPPRVGGPHGASGRLSPAAGVCPQRTQPGRGRGLGPGALVTNASATAGSPTGPLKSPRRPVLPPTSPASRGAGLARWPGRVVSLLCCSGALSAPQASWPFPPCTGPAPASCRGLPPPQAGPGGPLPSGSPCSWSLRSKGAMLAGGPGRGPPGAGVWRPCPPAPPLPLCSVSRGTWCPPCWTRPSKPLPLV